MVLFKKGISPVVASALLLVVAVVAVVGFQTWFGSYSSNTFSDVETKSSSSVGNTKIEDVIDGYLYFKNSDLKNNLTITSIKMGGVDCNLTLNVSSNSIETIDVRDCVNQLTDVKNEVVIYTDNGIVSQYFLFDNLNISIPQDTMPNSFSFTNLVDVNLSNLIVSETIIPSGFTGILTASVTGDGIPQLSINGGSWATSNNISLGDNLTIRLTSSNGYLNSSLVTLNIGNYSTTWNVTTRNYTLIYSVESFESAFSGENIPGWTKMNIGLDHTSISQSSVWVSNGTYAVYGSYNTADGNQHIESYMKTIDLTNVSKIVFDYRFNSWSSYGYIVGSTPFIQLQVGNSSGNAFCGSPCQTYTLSDSANGTSLASPINYYNVEFDTSNIQGNMNFMFGFHGRNSAGSIIVDNIRFLG